MSDAGAPDPFVGAGRWALERFKRQRQGFLVGSVIFSALLFAVAALWPASGDLSDRLRVAALTFVAALVVLLVGGALVALLMAPYGQRNRLREQVRSLQEEESPPALHLEVRVIAAEQSTGWTDPFKNESYWHLCFGIRNDGAACDLKAAVVADSVKGLTEDYPKGSDFPLSWQAPNDEPYQRIGRGSTEQIRLGLLWTESRALRFLGPGTLWKVVRLDADEVSGLIDVRDDDRDLSKRFRFTISCGAVDPVGLAVEPV